MSNEKTYCEQHGHFCPWCDNQIPLIDGNTSDGYHTFNELYEHRIGLFLALCRYIDMECELPVWKSKKHSDGTSFKGWFVLGIGVNSGEQITYHLPLARWRDCKLFTTKKRAPKYDGHTPADVLDRLKRL